MLDVREYLAEDGTGPFAEWFSVGGTKKRQQRDVEAAQARWADYKRRKRLAR